jgi:predicted branched-subunit amino acid permease
MMQPSENPAQPSDYRAALFRAGVKKGAPTLFGVTAWGLVMGVAMAKSQLSLVQALAMSLLVYAGSAQLASLPLIAAHAPIWVIFATAMVVNLRFMVFSILLSPHFRHLRWYKRVFLGFMSGDLTVALFMLRFPSEKRAVGKVSYLTGLVYPNWLAWQVGSITGILIGSQIPPEWGFSFAGTVGLMCVTIPLIINRAALFGVVVASTVAVLAYGWPYKLGLMAALLLGMLSAMALEEWQDYRKQAG